jgi:hypothetical protein
MSGRSTANLHHRIRCPSSPPLSLTFRKHCPNESSTGGQSNRFRSREALVVDRDCSVHLASGLVMPASTSVALVSVGRQNQYHICPGAGTVGRWRTCRTNWGSGSPSADAGVNGVGAGCLGHHFGVRFEEPALLYPRYSGSRVPRCDVCRDTTSLVPYNNGGG